MKTFWSGVECGQTLWRLFYRKMVGKFSKENNSPWLRFKGHLYAMFTTQPAQVMKPTIEQTTLNEHVFPSFYLSAKRLLGCWFTGNTRHVSINMWGLYHPLEYIKLRFSPSSKWRLYWHSFVHKPKIKQSNQLKASSWRVSMRWTPFASTRCNKTDSF